MISVLVFTSLAAIVINGATVDAFQQSSRLSYKPECPRHSQHQLARSTNPFILLLSSLLPEEDVENPRYEDPSAVLVVTTNSRVSIAVAGRKRQIRRKAHNRRPKYYWTQSVNLCRELQLFWLNHAQFQYETYDDTNNPLPVLLPSEILLQYYHRHDLRAAIASQGGRTTLAEILPARIMPGRWDQVVAMMKSDDTLFPEIHALLLAQPSLSLDVSPISPMAWPSHTHNNNNNNNHGDPSVVVTNNKWTHNKELRHPKGYWNLTRVVQELYEYVEEVKHSHNRPSVWMPRPSEMTASGRDDLKQAMQRFGGSKLICKLAGLIPFREWYYFEGQLELLILLKQYLDEYCSGDYSIFPAVANIRRQGGGGGGSQEKLYSLIQYYGGRKYLATRFSMDGPSTELCWGPFDLDFAIALLTFVRNDLLQKQPPLTNRPHIWMPSPNKLQAAGEHGRWLHTKILEFGGYENVARRLGLAFFAT